MGLALTVGAVATGPLRPAEAAGDGAAMSRGFTFDEAGGAALYAHVCVACHQADARGAIGAGAYPSLEANPSLASKDYVLGILLEGRGAMPPLGRLMSDAQVADVVTYLRSHFGNAFTDATSAAEVADARAAKEPRP